MMSSAPLSLLPTYVESLEETDMSLTSAKVGSTISSIICAIFWVEVVRGCDAEAGDDFRGEIFQLLCKIVDTKIGVPVAVDAICPPNVEHAIFLLGSDDPFLAAPASFAPPPSPPRLCFHCH